MCGTCEGVCPVDAVRMIFNPKKGIPEPQVDQAACTRCGACMLMCPGYATSLPRAHPPEAANTAFCSEQFGTHLRVLRMHATDRRIYEQGASGGMVTAILVHLLQADLIDGAVVTRMNETDPLQRQTAIVTTADDLMRAQKSKYIPNPMNRVLKRILGGDIPQRRLAYVGLPCHMEALRLAQGIHPILGERIRYRLSLFCSRTPSMHATCFTMNCLGITSEKLRAVQYRSGEHPGCMSFETNEGRRVTIPHLDWRYWGHAFAEFFYPTRCYLCHDKTGEHADFSLGDNWQRFGEDAHGASTVIVRTPKAEQVVEAMVARGSARLTHTLTESELIYDQDLADKRSMGNRFFLMRLIGRTVPRQKHVFPLELRTMPQAARLFLHVLLGEYPLPFWFLYPCIYISSLMKRAGQVLTRLTRATVGRLYRAARLFWVAPRREKVGAAAPTCMVIGGFGSHDIGDEAMPRAAVRNLHAAVPEVAIVMVSPDPAYTQDYHRERAIPDVPLLACARNARFRTRCKSVLATAAFLLGVVARRCGVRLRLWPNARTFLDELESADLLYNVGGGNLNSVIPTELYKKCTYYLAARILRKPVLISGQTIGPFTHRLDALWARICLDHVATITLRDKATSRGRLEAIGVRRPAISDTADDAMTLPTLPREEAFQRLKESVAAEWFSVPAKITIAMNLKGSLRFFKGEGRSESLSNEIRLMAELADRLVEACDARILFVPTDYCPNVDDRVRHAAIVEAMRHPRRAACIETEYDDITLKGLIALTDIAIGARYHFCVFAASELVPFLGIASGEYQQTKLRGLADLCELPECFFPDDMEFAKSEDVWEQALRIVRERERIRSVLARQVPMLKERSLAVVKQAAAYLRSGARHAG